MFLESGVIYVRCLFINMLCCVGSFIKPDGHPKSTGLDSGVKLHLWVRVHIIKFNATIFFPRLDFQSTQPKPDPLPPKSSL
jgi:hypothetical protein